MKDSAIVDLYWQRSEQAISETDKKYGSYCHTIAYNICNNSEDAEECIGDTWFHAWNLMPDKRPSALSCFLGAITRNLAINRSRSGQCRKRGGGQTALALEELAECVPSPATVESTVELRELELAIDGFLSRLPERERRVFLCRYWFLAPTAEIARKLGYSQSKVKTMLFRVRNKLKQYLQEEGLC